MPLPDDPKLLALAQSVIDQFDTIFGVHPGFRPAHAKGMLVAGKFTPAAKAGELSAAPHFSRPSTPVTVRFSNSTGLPTIPDNDGNADPRGMAIRFHLAEHSHTDIVSHSIDMFPVRTGEEFRDFLHAVATSDMAAPSDPKKPKPIEVFLGSHPSALAFVTAPKPMPTSFGRQSYFAVSAYKFTNASGASRYGRYRIVPVTGNEYLDAMTARSRSADYLFDELKSRLARGPIEFSLKLQLAEKGDVTDDATARWPESRQLVELGKVSLEKPVANDAVEQKQIIFDPIPRVTGIEPSADPLPELRAAVYLITGRRRRAAK